MDLAMSETTSTRPVDELRCVGTYEPPHEVRPHPTRAYSVQGCCKICGRWVNLWPRKLTMRPHQRLSSSPNGD
jgi:hypothetical protein